MSKRFSIFFKPFSFNRGKPLNQTDVRVYDVISNIDKNLNEDVTIKRIPSFAFSDIDTETVAHLEPPAAKITNNSQSDTEKVLSQIKEILPIDWFCVDISENEDNKTEWIIAPKKTVRGERKLFRG